MARPTLPSRIPHLPTPYRDEGTVVAQRMASLADSLDWPRAAEVAAPWVAAVRRHPPPFWAMESLLKDYPIASDEGLALMRLAEALLRVPDADTAIALTADQLGRADFGGAGDGALARLSGAAIELSKKFLPQPAGESANASTRSATGRTARHAADGTAGAAPHRSAAAADGRPAAGLMARLGARTVVAAALRALQLLGRQFVLGENIGAAMAEAGAARRQLPALTYSYDMLGEGARTEADAQRYLASYADAIRAIAQQVAPGAPAERSDGISIKLSALHPRYEDAQHARVMAELVPRVWTLCALAATAGINLTIDAEESDRLELSLDVFEALAERVAAQHPQWRGFGLALQAYQTRALELVAHVAGVARRHRLRFMCRLVKGAYWDGEIKRAQEMGLPHYPVFTHKHHTDVSYLACAKALLAASDAIYPQFATHNAGTIAAILQMAAETGAPFELQRLHGMGEGIYREVLRDRAIACRVYAPVGQHRDLLAYLVRRLLENGANSSFVHQLADESVGMDALLVSPLWRAPAPGLPLPPQLYGPGRRNSAGLDLAAASMRDPLLAAYPATQIPAIPQAAPQQAQPAVDRALAAGRAWSAVPVARRADILRRAADAMEAAMPHLCAMLVKEAFKTWGDAVSEVREGVDFLRFYAGEAERIMEPVPLPGPTGESNTLRLAARGPWVCISPWNFPLAIFTGQVAAALATGNTVLAKPAEQTPAIAAEAVALLHAAGVPADALQLLHGQGETVGAALVAAPHVAGVVFTGSTQVARTIHRALAAKDGPIVPLIAETGGVNAMVVDSTALPEQVVDAVVQSAFRSAGQRCSALRLLCVHAAIADRVIGMLRGAARELATGDAALLSTDVGPVIDVQAFETLQRQIAHLRGTATTVLDGPSATASTTSTSTSTAATSTRLIAPHAFEVARIADVREEIFGPVLQIVRWDGDPQAVIDAIDALGFGLTLGIQTRIDSRAQALAARAHAGNVYVNRNMIGAVVGVQPFGGEGLSGTGPKAGGPHYLVRFCAERTVTVNTAAAGGNATLLAGPR